MRYRVHHVTRYRYPATVHGSLNELRLKPRATPLQRLDQYRLEVQPQARYLAEYVDAFGNPACVLDIEQVHREWSVSTVFEVTRGAAEAELPFESPLSLPAARASLKREFDAGTLDARGYSQASPLLPVLPDLLPRLGLAADPDEGIEVVAGQLSRFIHREFDYRPGQTEISTPLSQVIENRVGVCQDFAHLAIACCRALGIPARYVSGYLETLPPEGAARLIGADATHAWFAVYDPARGWLEFDPTNDRVPDQRYITLGWGRDYSDVAPIRGVVRGGGESHSMLVSVDVQRIGDDAPVVADGPTGSA
jgi:transglutaminase-like putative cysteine protease